MDIWALGITLSELLVFGKPTDGLRDRDRIRDFILDQELEVPDLGRSSLIQSFVESMLVYDPSQRPSARRLLNAEIFRRFDTSQVQLPRLMEKIRLNMRPAPRSKNMSIDTPYMSYLNSTSTSNVRGSLSSTLHPTL